MSSLDTLHGEALDIVRASDKAGHPLRLLGGLAVLSRCPSFKSGPFARDCGDMDLAGQGPSGKLEAFIVSKGYKPEAEFNMYNGGSRLLFRSPSGAKVDVFVGGFSMCHRLDFGARLTRDELTLPLAELLVTKLQVVEANEKDLSDAACLLADHAPGEEDGDMVNLARLAELCANDWGLFRTIGMSLEKLEAWVNSGGIEATDPRRESVLRRSQHIREHLEACPKGTRFKLRAAIGDRVRWYETVEEAER